MKNIIYIKTRKMSDEEFTEDIQKGFASIIDENDLDHNLVVNDSPDGGDYMIAYLTDDKYKAILKLFIDHNIHKSHKNITEDLIFGNFVNDDVEVLANSKKVKSFISQVLTVDLVLDKINLKGIDSLTEIDKEILEAGI